ncbi:hypothetical protein [Amycolatopsis kentuckyensis]|uniref:hypothetical protein n=1 Tax=Amycolatopsis kentuckyensis TaxID=218823 RepID=UPI003562BF4B
MSDPIRELDFLTKAYGLCVAELGATEARKTIRRAFDATRAQQILDAYAARKSDAIAEATYDADKEALACPHCTAVDRIVEVDACVRRNAVCASGDGEIGVDLQDVHIEHQRFECDACGRPVTVPSRGEIAYC